jgi:hypothetical protein
MLLHANTRFEKKNIFGLVVLIEFILLETKRILKKKLFRSNQAFKFEFVCI